MLEKCNKNCKKYRHQFLSSSFNRHKIALPNCLEFQMLHSGPVLTLLQTHNQHCVDGPSMIRSEEERPISRLLARLQGTESVPGHQLRQGQKCEKEGRVVNMFGLTTPILFYAKKSFLFIFLVFYFMLQFFLFAFISPNHLEGVCSVFWHYK